MSHFAKGTLRVGIIGCAFSLAMLTAWAEAADSKYALTILATFNGANGASPQAGLVADSNGNLYGITPRGGANDAGTLFKIDAATRTFSTLITFGNGNGGYPDASLIVDGSNNLYGTTRGGVGGTIFKVDAQTQDLMTLASFDGTNGSEPYSTLLRDADGNLYGTTSEGGTNNKGTVFKLPAGSNTISTLVSFDGSNGNYPHSGLIADKNGNLYGTTVNGGMHDLGTVYKIDGMTHELTTLVHFDRTNGAQPFAGLVADGGGNLYGATTNGEPNAGEIFKIAAGTNQLATLAELNGYFGYAAESSLIIDSDGNLYGAGILGGPLFDNGGYGTVFKVDSVTHEVSLLASFNNINGAFPYGSLVMDANGNLYGTTSGNPGSDGNLYGSVFMLSPVPEPVTFLLFAVAAPLIVRLRSRGKQHE